MANEKFKLTGPQRNSLRVTLTILNEIIDNIENLCVIDKKEGILYYTINDLSKQERDEIIKRLRRIRRYIGYLNKYLEFEKERKGTRQIIASQLASLWEMVWEIESKRLSSYGKVDISLKMNLDPIVNKLIKLLNESSDILQHKTKSQQEKNG
jgi:hypothetical protein